MGAKRSVLGLLMSFPPYLRSAMVQFPLPIGYFDFGIGVFQNYQLVIKLPIGDFELEIGLLMFGD